DPAGSVFPGSRQPVVNACGGGVMRVAYVCCDPGIPVYGAKGCSLHVQEILRALVARGAEVELFAVRVGGAPPVGLESVRVCQAHVAKHRNSGDREQALVNAGERVTGLLDERGPFDLVYERHALWSAAAMQWAARRGVPSILEVNAPLIEEQATHRTLVDADAARRIAAECLTAAGVVACVSRGVADYAQGLGAAPSRTIVVPNGVRTSRFQARRPRTSRSAPFTVGFLGSLRPWHAVDDLLRAFALMDSHSQPAECSLVVVGDGPRREHLQHLVAQQPIAVQRRVQLVGAVAPAETPSWLAWFDAAVAPYAAGCECYFSPLKLFEYMAAGLPIVAADSGQMSEVISHAKNGLLYQPGNLLELRDRLELLKQDPASAEHMGATARQEAAREHAWETRLDSMLGAAGLCLNPSIAG
ncbi:MAG: glycosyltransferase family 4 protein, partial [Planctomycetales bacterium]|nr:glycosyltransferase family 4 protein [Planctomycetales bacterium]